MPSIRRAAIESALFLVFGGPAIVLVVIPWLLTRFRVPAATSRGQIAAGALLMVAGTVPLLESAVRFIVTGRGALVPTAPTERLVVSGLYRYVRNPMYLGVLCTIAGEALLLRNRGLIVEWVVTALGFETFVRAYEEPKLRRTFGTEYADYCRKVPRWIPKTGNREQGLRRSARTTDH